MTPPVCARPGCTAEARYHGYACRTCWHALPVEVRLALKRTAGHLATSGRRAATRRARHAWNGAAA